jgi:hypothetical protein
MSTAQVALLISAAAGLVGLYGAINSARALRWQRARDAERRQVRAHIEIEHAVTDVPHGADPLSAHVESAPVHYRLDIALVNDSEELAIFVREFGIWASGLGIGVVRPNPDARLEPRERYVRGIPLDEGDLRNLGGGFVVRAKLTTGDVIECEGQLDAWLLDSLRSASSARRREKNSGG